jgi:hypothetical protein
MIRWLNIIVFYMRKRHIEISFIDKFGYKFVKFPPHEVDLFYEWIIETQQKFSVIQFEVFK